MMSPSRSLQILLVDDDFLVLSQLARLVQETGHRVAGQCLSIAAASEWLAHARPDVVICDIVFGRTPSGPAWARTLQQSAIPYLLVSGGEAPVLLEHLAPEETATLLHKPVRKRDLFLQLEAIIHRTPSGATPNPATLAINAQGNTWVIPQTDLLYAESNKNDHILHTAKRRFIAHGSLQDLHQRLNAPYFARIHRSYVVQLKAVRAHNARFVILSNGRELPIGRKYQQTFRAALQAYRGT